MQRLAALVGHPTQPVAEVLAHPELLAAADPPTQPVAALRAVPEFLAAAGPPTQHAAEMPAQELSPVVAGREELLTHRPAA